MSPKKKRKPTLPPRIRAKGDGFRAVVVLAGRRVYGPTFETVEQAVGWLESIDRTGPDASQPLTLDDGLDLLRADLTDSAAAEGTVQFYDRAHLELCYVLGGDMRLDRIDGTAVRLYIDRRKREGIALQTIVRKELGTLRRIIRLAMATGRLGRDPMAGVKLPRVRTGRFDVIAAETVADAIAAIRAENGDHADIVEMIWRTGLRRAEAARVQVVDIDFAARRLFTRGKTNDRYRPIATDLEPVLRRMIARTDGEPETVIISSTRKIENVFGRWAKKLELPAFSPHVLRHGFVSDLLDQGHSPAVVASLVGHTSLRQLPRYYHAGDAALRAAADALGKGPKRQRPAPLSEPEPDRPAPAP